MKSLFSLSALILLAACGADGAPVAPSQAPASTLAITGEARVGIQGGL
ncbi:MAG: argininosuccinate lyase [Rhodobacter sp.]|nr:argininosuccinate lyase [Rhodobacter sp.]